MHAGSQPMLKMQTRLETTQAAQRATPQATAAQTLPGTPRPRPCCVDPPRTAVRSGRGSTTPSRCRSSDRTEAGGANRERVQGGAVCLRAERFVGHVRLLPEYTYKKQKRVHSFFRFLFRPLETRFKRATSAFPCFPPQKSLCPIPGSRLPPGRKVFVAKGIRLI